MRFIFQREHSMIASIKIPRLLPRFQINMAVLPFGNKWNGDMCDGHLQLFSLFGAGGGAVEKAPVTTEQNIAIEVFHWV